MLSRILKLGVLLVVLAMGLVGCAEKPIPCPEGTSSTAEISAKKTAPRELTPTECAQRVISERDTTMRDLAKSNDERDVAKKQYDALSSALATANFSTETDPTTGAITVHQNTVANADTTAAPAPTIEAGKVENTAQPAAPASKAN
jgi:uncharacterized protein with LGFP repeats